MPSLRKRQTAPASEASKSRQTQHGAGVDEIGDGVETLDGKTGKAVHDHPLGGRGPGRGWKAGLPAKAYAFEACQQADKGYSGAKDLSLNDCRFFPAVVPS